MGTIVISGAASGIGRATARRFTDAGHRVIGIDLHTTEIVADLETAEGRAAAVERVTALADGRLDGLVTCAGKAGLPSRPGSVLAAVNYFGTVALLEGLRPLLARGQSPAATAISSNSTTAQPGVSMELVSAFLDGDEARARALADEVGSLATYPASKLAVAHWVRTQATTADWAGAGIRLNALAPGMVETPLVAEGRADPDVGPMLALFPLPIGRTGQPEEIAALIEFVMGEYGGFFCGSVIFVDGGTDALLRPRDWPAPWDIDPGQIAAAFGGGPAG
jgi:NAD(P)-dependent dehydrogenase (short-subunit alcohol dehydrogenase family)